MATETTKLTFIEGAAASTPAANRSVIYAKADGLMYSKDDAGAETPLGGGSSDLDAIITASSGQDIADALSGAAAPDAGNVFATMADVGGGGPVILRGRINGSAGTITAGTGFSISAHPSAGHWTIDFTSAFAAAPAVFLQAIDAAATSDIFTVETVSTTQVTIWGTTSAGGSFADKNFSFMAVEI